MPTKRRPLQRRSLTKRVPEHQAKSRDYEVGYGKPPKHTRFKPGQSGNPKGRPKNHDELRDLIQMLAADEVADRGERLTRIEQMLKSMFTSRSPVDKQSILEHGWGRVPQQFDLNVKDVDAAIERELARVADRGEGAIPGTPTADAEPVHEDTDSAAG